MSRQIGLRRRPQIYTTPDGRVVVDLTRRLVRVQGEIVHLTPKEFRLLAALTRRAGKVVPHETLLAEVWGPDVNEICRLKQYIRYLRRKLEPDPHRPRYILTAWGLGYYIVAQGRYP